MWMRIDSLEDAKCEIERVRDDLGKDISSAVAKIDKEFSENTEVVNDIQNSLKALNSQVNAFQAELDRLNSQVRNIFTKAGYPQTFTFQKRI